MQKTAAQIAQAFAPEGAAAPQDDLAAAVDENREKQDDKSFTPPTELEQLDALIENLTQTVDQLTVKIAASDREYTRLSGDAAREYNRGKLARIRYNVLSSRLASHQALRDETASSLL